MRIAHPKVNNLILSRSLLFCILPAKNYFRRRKMVVVIAEKLIALQKRVGISTAEWAKLSGVSESTIRKILSKNTEGPRVDTVKDLVESVGVPLNEFLADSKEVDVENNAAVMLKDVLDGRIEALRERLDDYRKYAERMYRDRNILAIVVAALMAVLVAILVFDIAIGTHGWVQY
jgi:transcriptional regulator with XRE-family HTH domain